jgi:hypothetical protein
MNKFVLGVGLDSSKDITSSSWSTLHGENKRRDDHWGPWEEEVALGLEIRKDPFITRFLIQKKYLNL